MERLRPNTNVILFFFVFILGFLISLESFPRTEQGENYQLTLTGSKTWTVGYGIGDASGLARLGASAYQLSLDQSLAVDIKGEALSVLTINAHFNDQESSSMQTLTINLDTDNLKGVLGDFSLSGQQAFAVYNKKLKGLRLDYLRDETTLTGIVSQIEGISESQTFTGRTGHDEVLYAASYPDTPWITKPYQTNISGLYAYPLTAPYIVDFSEVNLEFVTTDALKGLLADYGLGYLYDDIATSPTVDVSASSYSVVTDESDIDNLILKSEPNALLRRYLTSAISTYNREHDLFDSDEYKTYPFNTGSEYELRFLYSLAEHVSLMVDGDSYVVADAVRHRFYYLGKTNIMEDSISVQISQDSETFLDISEPLFAGYSVNTYEGEGIIEFDFPSHFFENPDSAVLVSFDYSISGDVFNLGLSVVPASEKVYLNGELIVRDKDYSIDYDVGLLVLFSKIGDKDTIRIDYERSRGGLGSSAEYARNFYGAMLTLPVSPALTLDLSMLQAADSVTSSEDRETMHTMPNTHTVSGVAGTIDLDGFSAGFTVGYNNDVFPFDDNLRLSMPNQISSIVVAGDYTIVASLNGLSVGLGDEWTAYGAASGLSGSRVYTMARDGENIYFGTSSGLSQLKLVGEAPFDQVGNWKRYYTDDGLPDVAVHSLLVSDGILYLGTEGGIAVVPTESLDDFASYRNYNSDAFSTVYALAMSEDELYVGTDSGLFTLDFDNGRFEHVSETVGEKVNALLASNGNIYIASSNGLGLMRGNKGAISWIFENGPVYAVCLNNDDIYYGTNDGLYNGDTIISKTEGMAITAIGRAPDGALWAGCRADSDYYMEVLVIKDRTSKRFDNYDLHLDGHDNFRFKDIPALDHTDTGVLVRASFNRSVDSYKLSGSFELVQPTFTSIGRTSRSDSTGWILNGSFNVSDGVDLVISHSFYEIDYRTEDPRNTLENRASLSIDLGVHADISISQSLVNDDFLVPGFERSTIGYALSLSDRLLSDSLSLSLGWTDSFYGGNEGSSTPRQNRLSGSVDWSITPEVRIRGNWARPMSFGLTGASGSEKWSVTGSVKHSFTGFSADFAYKVDGAHNLADDNIDIAQTADLDVRVFSFSISDFRLTPRLTLDANKEGGMIVLGGQASLQATVSDVSANGSVARDVSGYGQDREQIKDRISASLAYTGIPDFKPNLSYSQNSSLVTYRGESRGTTTMTLTGSLSWTPPDGSRDTLRLSARSSSGSSQTNDLTITLNNTYTFTTDPFREGFLYKPLGVRVYVDGSYSSGEEKRDISLSVETSADLTISETWQTSLTGSYLTGTKSDGELYNSLLLELFIAARF
jgi:hypothetical protein